MTNLTRPYTAISNNASHLVLLFGVSVPYSSWSFIGLVEARLNYSPRMLPLSSIMSCKAIFTEWILSNEPDELHIPVLELR